MSVFTPLFERSS